MLFFNTNEEINRLRKEISRLLSKGISNIYLKVTIEKKWPTQNFYFKSFLKKFVSLSSVSSTHADIIEFSTVLNFQFVLNFQLNCSNLKIKGLEVKLCLALLLFYFERNYDALNPKESMIFVEQKYKL